MTTNLGKIGKSLGLVVSVAPLELEFLDGQMQGGESGVVGRYGLFDLSHTYPTLIPIGRLCETARSQARQRERETYPQNYCLMFIY